VFECPAAVWPVTSEDHLSSQSAFDSKQVTQLKPNSTRLDVGKTTKYNFAFCAAGDAGEKVTLIKF